MRNRASAAYLLCGKHISTFKQAKDGVGGFFSRMESLNLYQNMSNRASSGESMFVCVVYVYCVYCLSRCLGVTGKYGRSSIAICRVDKGQREFAGRRRKLSSIGGESLDTSKGMM